MTARACLRGWDGALGGQWLPKVVRPDRAELESEPACFPSSVSCLGKGHLLSEGVNAAASEGWGGQGPKRLWVMQVSL